MNITTRTLYVGLLIIDTTTYAFTSPYVDLIGKACVRKANDLLDENLFDVQELIEYIHSDDPPTHVEFYVLESDYLDMV